MDKQLPDLSRIRAFLFDVDGVLTDGGVFCTLDGELLRTFDAKDGFALRMAVMNGYAVGCITGGRSVSIRKRLLTSGLVAEDIYLGSRYKDEDFEDFCYRHGVEHSEVMFFGDDVPDIGALTIAGVGVCPADGAEDARAAADYVSPYPGGKGCVRDMMERTMKVQGRWNFDAYLYKKLF